ncbi:MAG TPA: hypothetical protein PKC21_09630 [Oligoflexia bacterium]|nr:hypothetical protein [Oligoflexia bacterium]HMR25598.1 hypothetical protein [Oligoflexia bacterium]
MKTYQQLIIGLIVFVAFVANAKSNFDSDIEELSNIIEAVENKVFRNEKAYRKQVVDFINKASAMQLQQAEALRYKYEIIPYNDEQVNAFNLLVLKAFQTEISFKKSDESKNFIDENMAFYTMIPTDEYMNNFTQQELFSQNMIDTELRKLAVNRRTRFGFAYEEYQIDSLGKLLLMALLKAKGFYDPDIYFSIGINKLNALVDSVNKAKNKEQILALFHIFINLYNPDLYRAEENSVMLSRLMRNVCTIIDCTSNLEKRGRTNTNNDHKH